MRICVYTLYANIKGGGNSGKRMSSLIRAKLGVNDVNYEPSMEIGRDYIKLYGDKFSLDYPRCGKEHEKYFVISQETVDGQTVITIKNISPYPIVFHREGWEQVSGEPAEKHE